MKKIGTVALSTAMAITVFSSNLPVAKAANSYTGSLKNVVSAELGSDKNVVYVNFNDDVKGKITFLDNGMFRYNVDLSEDFAQYADNNPSNKNYVAKIQKQPDSSDVYSHPDATVKDENGVIAIQSNGVTIEFDKATAKMAVKNASGQTVMQESEPLTIGSSTKQSLATDSTEYFYGGGTQNGRFSHKGQRIEISNGGWNDGGVASPSPFYWSTKGYGVMRNTFRPGSYDFGAGSNNVVTTSHNEKEFDAYYFVPVTSDASETAEKVLQDYFKVTGDAMLLPEYAYYLSQLNCYNRDSWRGPVTSGGWIMEDGQRYAEDSTGQGYVIPEGAQAETLNNTAPSVLADKFKGVVNDNTYKFSARAVIDGHADNDMPLGWFLPNDGYGCGYGQNGYYEKREGNDTTERDQALDANIDNLKQFTEYANAKGVQTGLWTQAALNADDSEKDSKYQGYQTLRDFNKEVNVAGVAALKTDVAWVGQGYAMGLNSVKTGYDTIALSGRRPNVVSLYGWAGTQRYAGIWTGDQTGGQWEYIRFHIPTYIGQSLSGNPNVASDVNGIHGGGAVIQTRDYEWKTFTQLMLDMDGWGSEAKKPYSHGDPYISINRMYLKMKAQMMPYLYTAGYEATNGLPAIRAMFLEFPDDPNTYGKNVQYQYMFGENLLVAPVYEDVKMDAQGNDVRNGIYLPGGKDQIWIDYFTGEQYRGGQTLNNFDAPLWKLPLFVKNGAIVPMYEDNNNPSAVTEANPKGLDKTKRMIEFWPAEGKNSYDLFEDDGISIDFETTDTESSLSYGNHVDTTFTSEVKGTTATLTAEKSTGSYTGYDANRKTTFVVNVSEKPESIQAKNGTTDLNVVEAKSLDDYKELAKDDTKTVYYYDAQPDMNAYSKDGEAFKDTKLINAPKLYVKFARTNVQNDTQTLIINGFKNEAKLSVEEIDENMAVPALTIDEEKITARSIDLNWTEVENATSYDLDVDGIIYNFPMNSDGTAITTFKHNKLEYHSTHNYRIRARGDHGYSAWSEFLGATTLLDPWKDSPEVVSYKWPGGTYSDRKIDRAFDRTFQSGDGGFHSDANATGVPLTMDMGQSFQMDKLEYYPRDDNGNGTVTRMKVEISLDGQNWKVIDDGSKSLTYEKTGLDDYTCATFTMTGESARYIRMTSLASKGGYFAAREIVPWKVEDTKGTLIGDVDGLGSIDDADLKIIQQYAGIAPHDKSWGQVKSSDINMNGVFDVYDYTYTAFALNGGTKKTGSASGNMLMVTSKEDVAAGESFTIDVYGDSMKNVNAFGAIMKYDPTQYEVIGMDATEAVGEMNNYSKNSVYAEQGEAYYTLSFVNVGDKPVLSGSKKLATITMKALTAGKAYKAEEAMLIGPDHQVALTEMVGPGDEPEAPADSQIEYKQSDFNITMTNDELTTDDGTNVEKMTQQKSYKNLFNDVKTYVDGSVFEFKWNMSSNWGEDGKLPSYIKLPTTMHFDFKQASKLTQIDVYNRASGNGTVQAIEAEVLFEDGTKQVFKDGEYGSFAEKYTFKLSNENTKKKATGVNITPLKATGTQMLTICEIDFIYNAKVPVQSIELDENNPTTIFANKLTAFNATLQPSDATDTFFTVESSDPEIIKVVQTVTNGVVSTSLLGIKAGTTSITVTSRDNPNVKAVALITVSDQLFTEDIDKQIKNFDDLYEYLYTAESYAKVKAIADDTKAVLANPSSTQADIDKAAVALENAFALLEVKGSNVDQPSSTDKISNEDFKLYDESSYATAEKQHGDLAFDGDPNTIWHSNYNGPTLPQWITVDLGRDYDLEQVNYLPRQGGRNGHITHYRVEVCADSEAADDELKFIPVVEGYLDNDGTSLTNPTEYKEIKFNKTTARYVRFIALGSLGDTNDEYASIAELDFFGKEPMSITSAIEKAEALIKNNKEETMTYSSWAAFKTAYDTAVAAVKNPDATKDELNIAATNLLNAISALETRISDEDYTLLADMYNESKALRDKYTEAEFAGMDAVLKDAKDLLSKGRKEISDKAAYEVILAMVSEQVKLNQLAGADVLLENLADTIALANAIMATDEVANARPGKVAALQAAIDAGQALVDEASTDRVAIQEAVKAINDAAHELWEVIAKDKLEAAIKSAEEAANGNYEETSLAALQASIKAAKEVAANDDATSDEVENAWHDLIEKMQGLKPAIDTSALELQIEIAEGIMKNEGIYIPSTIEGLEALLSEAQAMVADKTATQEAIKEMTAKLSAANMKARKYADKKELQSAVNAVLKMNLDGYTKESVNSLKNVLKNAKDVLNNEAATDDEVKAVLADLRTAVSSLKAVNNDGSNQSNKPNNGTNGNTNNSVQNGSNTGDETNAAGLGMLILLAGAVLVIARRKSSYEKH